jgi:hypothetical protein
MSTIRVFVFLRWEISTGGDIMRMRNHPSLGSLIRPLAFGQPLCLGRVVPGGEPLAHLGVRSILLAARVPRTAARPAQASGDTGYAAAALRAQGAAGAGSGRYERWTYILTRCRRQYGLVHGDSGVRASRKTRLAARQNRVLPEGQKIGTNFLQGGNNVGTVAAELLGAGLADVLGARRCFNTGERPAQER